MGIINYAELGFLLDNIIMQAFVRSIMIDEHAACFEGATQDIVNMCLSQKKAYTFTPLLKAL